jgi:hypothetical protein
MSDYVSRIDYRGIRYPMTKNVSVLPSQRG